MNGQNRREGSFRQQKTWLIVAVALSPRQPNGRSHHECFMSNLHVVFVQVLKCFEKLFPEVLVISFQLSKDYSWDCNDHDDFLSSLLNDFGPTRTTQGINELGTDDATFEWENKDQYMDTDDLLQNLSSDENEVVDNITVDMGKKLIINICVEECGSRKGCWGWGRVYLGFGICMGSLISNKRSEPSPPCLTDNVFLFCCQSCPLYGKKDLCTRYYPGFWRSLDLYHEVMIFM